MTQHTHQKPEPETQIIAPNTPYTQTQWYKNREDIINELTLSQYLYEQKKELLMLISANMFNSAKIILDATINEYRARIIKGEF